MAVASKAGLSRVVGSARPWATCLSNAFRHSLSSSTSPAVKIEEWEVKQYEEDGATVLKGLFSQEWVEQLQEAGERNMKNPGPLCDEHVKPGEPGRFHDDQFLWHRHETMRRFVFESPAAEIARIMTRSKNVRLFYDQLLVKEPGTRTVTPWHNDQSYWQLAGSQIISIWLTLDHVPEASCVKYVKGSHLWKLLHKADSFAGDGRYQDPATKELPDMPDINSRLNEVQLLAWEMEPGDCLVHHGWAVHGAAGVSSSSGRRRGYASRWLGDDVRFDPRPGTMHYQWVKVGLDPKLKPGQLMESEMFPLPMAA